MNNDFLESLEFLGVTARLKRLNDSISASIKELYKQLNVDIEPSWHLVLLILKENNNLSLKEVAEKLKLSQPALTKMINRMVRKGYIKLVKNKVDNRKKVLKLTEKSINEMPKLEKIWAAGKNSIKQILGKNPNFLISLSLFEQAIEEKCFKDRAIYFLDKV